MTKAERERDALVAAIKGAYDYGHERMMALMMASSEEEKNAAASWIFFMCGVADVFERAFGEKCAEEDPPWDLPVKVGAEGD